MTLSPYASPRVRGFGETVFQTFTQLAREHGAINLGQGFPDFAPPEIIMQAYREAACGYQQYAPLPGMPELLVAAARAKGELLGREVDPARHIQVTVGATEALFAIMQAFIAPGDEVILIEPFYDAYPADVQMAGGTPVYVPLLPQADGQWRLDDEALRAAFSDKTKAIIVNTPHNPTGKVFSAAELDAIITLAERYNALIISDEVYETIAFRPFISPASRPGGWERTLAISSIGKTFSVTGWKVGYVTAPEPLINTVRLAHQWIPYTVATPLQLAAAQALTQALTPGNDYFSTLLASFQRKCEVLLDALRATPFKPMTPDGGYFVMADSSALGYADDLALCLDLPRRAGVVAIPPSAFYSEAHKDLARHLVRFAFCKTDSLLMAAGERLRGFGG
jgi:aspartate/methionine/tyrosine aminotransferase